MPVGLYDINAAGSPTLKLWFHRIDCGPHVFRGWSNPGDHLCRAYQSRGLQSHCLCHGTGDYPCQMPFSFTFKEGELTEYYKDWELVKYNEKSGISIAEWEWPSVQLRFATMLARKIKKSLRSPSILLLLYKQVEQGDLYICSFAKKKKGRERLGNLVPASKVADAENDRLISIGSSLAPVLTRSTITGFNRSDEIPAHGAESLK